jgi:hypothetical protein
MQKMKATEYTAECKATQIKVQGKLKYIPECTTECIAKRNADCNAEYDAECSEEYNAC